MMTIEKLKSMSAGQIIDQGLVENSENGIPLNEETGRMLRWIAQKGEGNSWTIYIHFAEHTFQYILEQGEKLHGAENIKKLIQCTEEVFELYQY